ncbi:MAG: carboxypeptidase-like regulatory domain-containing protein [Flavobacteriales bacterium]|nr:carboxypeptidase-like regulatory domain-containing protein [Flavobacteriales bacterium]
MKRIFFLLIISAMSIQTYAQSIHISGEIKDSVQTIPYASIFLKNTTTTGTMSSSDGIFSLNIPKAQLPDTLVISFVGYKPYYTILNVEKDTVNIHATLSEDVIELSDIDISTTKKHRNKKVEIETILNIVKEQMSKDFSSIEALYRIQTNTSIASSNDILAYQEALVDTYEKSLDEKDMTRRIETKVYLDQRAKDLVNNDKNNKSSTDIDPTTNIKGLTVTVGMIKDYLNEKSRKWEYSGQTDKNYIITFQDKKSFLGIFRYTNKCVLYIDKLTYSIMRADNHFTLYLNIPFGKKLPEEYLELVNVLNVTSDKQIDKFRLRKVDASFTMTSEFVKKGQSLYRSDSYSYGTAYIKSTKDQLNIALKSQLKVLNRTTDHPTPITEEQTKATPRLEVIDNM